MDFVLAVFVWILEYEKYSNTFLVLHFRHSKCVKNSAYTYIQSAKG